MKSVRLGKTEIMVSELGFGGIPIIQLEFDEAVSLVRYCFELGITFFDTANMYGDSEKKIGQALESVRDQVVLATKTLERTAEGAARHIGFSLKNLETDHIDVYQFHSLSKQEDLDKVLGPGGAMEAVKKAESQGRIRFIGLSSHDKAVAVKACRTGLFSTLQFPFNFIERDPADELFVVAREMDMGIIGMKPLGGGLLERADLCFKFLQEHPGVVPIPGLMARDEADEVIELYKSPAPLSRADREEIERIRGQLGTRFCHRCGYCLPCEQGVKIPEVMSFRSMSRRLPPAMTINMTKKAMETVDDCTQCDECLERCPYRLPIPELIRELQAMFTDFTSRHG